MFGSWFNKDFMYKTDISSLYKRIRVYRRFFINIDYTKYNDIIISMFKQCDKLLLNIDHIENMINNKHDMLKFLVFNYPERDTSLKYFLTDNDNNYDMKPEDKIEYLLDLLIASLEYYDNTLDDKTVNSTFIYIYITNMVEVFGSIHTAIIHKENDIVSA